MSNIPVPTEQTEGYNALMTKDHARDNNVKQRGKNSQITFTIMLEKRNLFRIYRMFVYVCI